MVSDNISLFLNLPRTMMRMVGAWVHDKYVLFYKIFIFTLMTLQYIFLLSEIVYIVQVWGDYDEVSEASYLIFTQASLCFKATVFLVHRTYLVDLMEFMQSEMFLPHTQEQERILNHRAQIIRRLNTFCVTSAMTTCTLWTVIPIIKSIENKRCFPYKIWMPVGPEESPSYEVGFTYQTFTVYTSALLFCGVDSTALSMIMFGCAQLEIIMDKVKKIQPVPMLLKMEKRNNLIKINNDMLLDCIRHLQAVVSYIDTVQKAYHLCIFFQLCATVGNICVIGLGIIMAEANSAQFFSSLNYLTTMVAQLLIFCWCGNDLTILCQDLRDELYQTPWYEQDRNFKRLLLFTLLRLENPILFKAGHYILLSRPTFVSVLRLSYSYFAVLTQSNSK